MSFASKRKIKQLRSDRAEVRAAAICAVAEMGDPDAVGPLGELLHDEERNLRVAAAQALGAIAHPSAIGPLIDGLVAENTWEVRYEIVEALRKIGDPAAVNRLVVILEGNREEGAREFAAWALKEFGWDQLNVRQQATIAIMQDDWNVVHKLGPEAVEPVCAALASGTPHVRRCAAEALAAIASDKAVAALVAGLDSDVADLRHTCACVLEKQIWANLAPRHLARVAVILHKWAIAISAGAEAIPSLMEAFRGGDAGTRRQIVDVLRSIGGREAATALVEAARNVDPDVRRAATSALAGTLNPDSADVLAAVLNDDDAEVRKAAAVGLTQLGWQPPDDATRVQLAIAAGDAGAVAKLGVEALPGLVESLRTPGARRSAMRLLAGFGADAVDPLLGLLRDQAAELRACAIETLAAVGDANLTARLLPMLSDSDPGVRRAVAAGLTQLGWQPADDGQRATVALACDDWEGLAGCGGAAVGPLLACLGEKSQRDAALGTIERLVHGEAAARLSAENLQSILEAVEAIAKPVTARRIMAGSALKQAVVCRRIAQLARGALQRASAGR
ncbi:MAG: HEAT repeat domain-containing protein [Phycisphaerales bacterium]|nr:HEAT repeat domain-containing protein [Phycisphaerales bacterium]